MCGKKVDIKKFVANIADLFRRKGEAQGNMHIITKMIDINRTTEEINRFYEMFSPISDSCTLEEVNGWSSTEGEDLTLGSKRNTHNGIPVTKHDVCPFPFYSMNVNANGDVGICCYDWAHQTIIGNIKQESMYEIWNGKRMYDFRMMHLSHRRRECAACKDCHSVLFHPDNLDGFEEQIIQALGK